MFGYLGGQGGGAPPGLLGYNTIRKDEKRNVPMMLGR